MIPPLDSAALAPSGPRHLLIVGPPGTGKTGAIVDEILPRLSAELARTLICSFTRSAAFEIRGRLCRTLGRSDQQLRHVASTIHAEAWRVVRVHGRAKAVLEGKPESALGDETPRLDNADRAARAVWDLARQRRIPVEVVALRIAPQYASTELRAIIDEYEARKRQNQTIDYVDMLELALDYPAPERDALIVDEAQDCTPLMAALVDHWASRSRRVVQIGDPDQVVHEWCGVDAGRLARLPESGYAVRRLTRSHRVPQRAHALAGALISLNRTHVPAPYEPRDHVGTVDEADLQHAIETISLAADAGTPVLVLARTARCLARYGAALAEAGVPYLHERGYSPLNDRGVVAAVKGILDLYGGRPLLASDAAALVERLPIQLVSGPTEGVADQIRVAAAGSRVTRRTLELAGVDVDPIVSASSICAALTAAGLYRVAEPLARIVALRGERAVRATPCVTLTTMHAAKGRGATVVALDLSLPAAVRRGLADGDDVLEAERRVLYVALTRTSDRLVLVRDRRRDLGVALGLDSIS